MWIKKVETLNFRNLEDSFCELGPGLNVFRGANGQGKTNFLECVYFGLTGKSFRTSRVVDMLRETTSIADVRVLLIRGKKTNPFRVSTQKGKIQRYLSGKPCGPLDFFKIGAAISFTGRSKNLIEGSPEDRRRFLDRMISYIQPEYIALLSQYRKINSQVRKILMTSRDFSMYKGFKLALAKVGFEIVSKRFAFLEAIQKDSLHIFDCVFRGSEEQLFFEYSVKNGGNLENYQNRMMDVSAQELLYNRSLMGPHLDDLFFGFQKGKAKKTASSGQIRAVVLSIKLAVRKYYHDRFGFNPILLLDDIDAELDNFRLERLLTFLNDGGQSLISTSKYDTIVGFRQHNVFAVEAGRIYPQRNDE